MAKNILKYGQCFRRTAVVCKTAILNSCKHSTPTHPSHSHVLTNIMILRGKNKLDRFSTAHSSGPLFSLSSHFSTEIPPTSIYKHILMAVNLPLFFVTLERISSTGGFTYHRGAVIFLLFVINTCFQSGGMCCVCACGDLGCGFSRAMGHAGLSASVFIRGVFMATQLSLVYQHYWLQVMFWTESIWPHRGLKYIIVLEGDLRRPPDQSRTHTLTHTCNHCDIVGEIKSSSPLKN